MRIASLLPAATEWVDALGATHALVGRSHECDHPEAVTSLPVLTAPTYPEKQTSRAIHEAVQKRVRDGLSLYRVDMAQLRALSPDWVLTQAQCEVCAASVSDIEADLQAEADADIRLFSMQPATFKEVLDMVLRLGRALNRAEAAMQWIARHERQLKQLHSAIGLERRTDPDTLPTVACIEWMDPLMVAGHWTPDVVAHGGGQPVLAEAGAASRRITWEALANADPDVIAVMPCGFSVEDTARDWQTLASHPTWQSLRAVQKNRVAVFDGNAYFNRPGPRLYRAAALIAYALYPDRVDGHIAPVQPWEMQRGSLRSVSASA